MTSKEGRHGKSGGAVSGQAACGLFYDTRRVQRPDSVAASQHRGAKQTESASIDLLRVGCARRCDQKIGDKSELRLDRCNSATCRQHQHGLFRRLLHSVPGEILPF